MGKTGVVEELVVTYGVVLLLELVETPVVLDELVVATEDVLLLVVVGRAGVVDDVVDT